MTASPQTQDDPMTNRGLTPDSAARYLNGAPPESDQFEFFIGDWSCELRLHPPGGEPATRLRGEWRAKWLHDRRILVDDLAVFLPSGEEVLAWINLRTYSPESGHWEITGQRALEPASGALTAGCWRDGEMHLAFETAHEDRTIRHRVRFFDITAHSFEWEWKHQIEAGSDWIPFTTMSARRMSEA